MVMMIGFCSSMANNKAFLFFFLSLLVWSFEFSQAQMVPVVFVIGDSQVDVGNNNYLPVSVAKANFPHNGIDFPTKKPTGRFSNGRNSADFLAEKVGLPTSPPYLSLLDKNQTYYNTGVSFASGGAGIFNSTDQVFGQSIPLTEQVSNYVRVHDAMMKSMGSSAAQKLVSKSLFAVVIGSNDLFDYFGSSKQSSPQGYVDTMVSTLKGQLQRLYAYDARKFLFTGIGVIGCIPAQRVKNETEECNEDANSMAVKYNQGLKEMLNGLKSELQGISYTYFDTYSIMQNAIHNPSAYGFKEVKSACCGLGKLKAEVPCVPISKYCGDRRDHVFWDLVHPTEATARIFVDAIFDGPSDYTFPVNLRQLLTASA